MNAGRIEQVGTPFEIYNYPSTTFVAGFVGTLNQLRCTVVDPATGQSSSTGRCSRALRWPPTDSPSWPLRPEELHFGQIEGENQLTGNVETVTFLGAIVRMSHRPGARRRSLSMPSTSGG